MVDDYGTLFCLQAVALFKSYFGGAFDEDAIRNNFVLIYELLDGMSLNKILTILCPCMYRSYCVVDKTVSYSCFEL